MDAERIDDVTDWEDAPFDGGFDELRELGNRDFSGAVTDGAAWLFMLNGRIVGVVDGELDDFADADGTAYEAPHSSLPLLYAMQEQGGEVRAQYYTNDTPLSKADRKLSSGNFTGYVELSENVLSGDYYTVYHGGDSLSAAFVGSAEQLKTGDEAFELADDEVGIYKVYDVDLDVRELPGTASEDGTDSSDTAVRDTGIATGSDTGSAHGSETGGIDDDREEDGRADDLDPIGGVNGVTGAVGGSTAADEPDSADDPGSVDEPDSADDPGSIDDPDSADDPGSIDESVTMDTAIHDDTEETESVTTDATSATDSPEDSADPSTEAPDRRPDEPSGANASTTNGVTADEAPETSPSGSSETRSPEAAGDDSDVFSQEEEWRETKSIPALDPEESETNETPGSDTTAHRDSTTESTSPAGSASGGTSSGGSSPNDSTDDDSSPAVSSSNETSQETTVSDTSSVGSTDSGSRASTGNGGPSSSSGESPSSGSNGASESEDVSQRPSVQKNELQRRVGRLESALEETESRRKELESRCEVLSDERDQYKESAERLESRVSELESQIETLERNLEDARAQLPDGEQSMSPSQALAGTNLFVRYDSQGGATLEKAHAGEIDREEVNTNLRLEHHTVFDAADVLVNGQPYREFLSETIEYGFTRWVIEDLLYEIRRSGNVGSMRNLYDAIPEIDRAEIGGEVSIHRQQDGEEHREQRQFDLVLRDRMGNPLIAADLNDSRDPTAEGSLESLVTDSGHIAQTSDSFTAAFAVTASFFEPGALEAVEDATGGGVFSRDKQKSFVKLTRKQGYHLCLVETRDGEFHLNVPEL